MKTFKKHLDKKLQDKEFKAMYDEERKLLEISLKNENEYYVNKNAQSNGEHEVHKSGCSYMPSEEHRIYLGSFRSFNDAIKEAKKYYSNLNGCYYCLRECHTT
jgi:hypothetical protein